MAAVGIVLAWAGYSIFYYGLNTVKGGNESFMSLIWPGKYQPAARDNAADIQTQQDLNQAYLPSSGTGAPGSGSVMGPLFNPNPPPPAPNIAPGTLYNIP